MVPKSQQRQTLLTMCPCKAEQFTLKSRQSYDSMLAIVLGKAQLVQTELGALLLGAGRAKAGAKRVRTLLSKLIWESSWIEEWLVGGAERGLKAREAQGVTPIAAWDGSVLEKHESCAG